MKRRPVGLVLLMLALATMARGQDAGLPIAPILPEAALDSTNAYRLRNNAMEVIVLPDIGRIAYVGIGTNDNLFRLDTRAAGEFANFGGDWFWPVAQSRWPAFNGGRDWPPPALLEKRPWRGRAWRTDDGGRVCLLRNEYGAPLHIRVSRRIRLEPDVARVRIDQRIERTAASDIPVTLWNVSQVGGAESAVLPVEQDVVTLAFNPADGLVTRCESSVVFDARSGTEHKLGSTSPRGWIAARRGDVWMVERAVSEDTAGGHPDGGCRVELYSNTGLGYTEIETLSVERYLKQGESLANVLTLDLWRAPARPAPCASADDVRERLGERIVRRATTPPP
jgi:hypothetical protein